MGVNMILKCPILQYEVFSQKTAKLMKALQLATTADTTLSAGSVTEVPTIPSSTPKLAKKTTNIYRPITVFVDLLPRGRQ
ncbi:hypothetical protein JTB14_033658 [Gonioctena quinquepunctata]|nr:hypothetical protein JTB14_033658 [Gonioctena quinquepunctata]